MKSRRWEFTLFGLDAAFISAWSVYALWVAPRIIAEAYHGRGIPQLVQVFGTVKRHSLAYYEDLWTALAWSVVLALLAHLGILAFGMRRGLKARSLAALAVVAWGFLLVTVASGARQDYGAYREIWKQVMSGGDPWWIHPAWGHPINAYGPLFNAFAPLFSWVNPLAPKLVFATSFLLLLVVWITPLGRDAAPRLGLLFGIGLHPSFWLHIAWYGHLDILVGIACLAAVRQIQRERDAAAGTALSLGVLLKYLPIVTVPFLALDGRRVRWRFVVAAFLTTAVGMGIAHAIWGAAPLRALNFTSSRDSQFLSVFRFLRGTYSPLRWFGGGPNLDPWATPILACALGLLWLGCFKRRVDVFTATTAAVIITVILYRVGFAQYHTVLLVLLISWCLDHRAALRGSKGRMAAVCAYLVWIAALDLLDWGSGGVIGGPHDLKLAEELAGLPTFLLGALLLAAVLTTPKSAPAPHPSSP